MKTKKKDSMFVQSLKLLLLQVFTATTTVLIGLRLYYGGFATALLISVALQFSVAWWQWPDD